MSTIIVPTMETSCCNSFKVDEAVVADDTRASRDNLDFIVTFLNIPQTVTDLNETEMQIDKNVSSANLLQNNAPSEAVTEATLSQSLLLLSANYDNNEENIENANENIEQANKNLTPNDCHNKETSDFNSSVSTTMSNAKDSHTTNEDSTPSTSQTNKVHHEEIDEADDVDDDDDDEEEEEEEELTNLTWLTELRNQSITWPGSINPTILDDNLDATAATTAKSNDGADESGVNNATEKLTGGNNGVMKHNGMTFAINYKNGAVVNNEGQRQNGIVTSNSGGGKAGATPLKRPTPAERYQIFMDKVKRDLQEYEQSAENYQTDTTEKPPFNYSHIIGMAMLEKGRVTLQQICSWIESKFAFFRVRKKWNNSIRHNLSLHHCFRKINRNKYEKGKGGYWELGVDPKKCDRKRIRNRKSANSMNKNKKITVQNNNNSNSSYNSEVATIATSAATLSVSATSAPQHHQQQLSDNDEIDMELDVQIPAAGLEEAQQMLLDDLDVQHNIDISSNQQQQQQQQLQCNLEQQLQQEEAFIANVLANCIELDPVTLNSEDAEQQLAGSNELPTLTTVATLPQYQLGTVIISTSTDDIATTLNSFIYNNQISSNSQTGGNEFCSTQLQQHQQHKILFREDEIPQACENVIVSSFLSDTSALDGQHSVNLTNPNRPNVIVEPLEQPYYSVISASATALVSANGDEVAGTTESGEHFRPYIDGIDEAFQYLRSMDHNRSEDLLDNLLDISVSDY